ncbi:TonB-dependent receptor family protein [Bacterioplanoides sp.]|uniref:TonB-dependent receptor family protein n=1 Tax=Bacterioplanoides sp. TaxID=2066072 RepID=UPI003B5AD87E
MRKLLLNPSAVSDSRRSGVKPLALAIALAGTSSVAFAEDHVELDNVYITGGEELVRTQPGSATLIDDVALEQFEYTDINRILNAVPGVNLQEEDGYGLRPNIGLRGTSPERSKKITLMEDGVLAGPAPYSAPAAYYFPNVSRMSAVEVFKGPSTIQYGPATVGGAVNLVSRPIPFSRSGELDVQYGSDNFQRYEAWYGGETDGLGYLVEGLRVSADGFKDLDGGGDTGFVRNDINTKFSWEILGNYSHRFQLKLGYADEVSDETYLGLSRADFDKNPNRRYRASSLDKMETDHSTIHLNHLLTLPSDSTVSTDVYRHNFKRDWFKVNKFGDGTTLQEVLQNPQAKQDYYNVITGQQASTNSSDQLLIGSNDRSYVSQGIQSRFNTVFKQAGLIHNLELGLRYHFDSIERDHTEQNYDMTAQGELRAVAGTFTTTTLNEGEAKAWALHIKDDIEIDNTTVTIGVRHENITSSKTNFRTDTRVKQNKQEMDQSVTLPGIGVYSQLTEELGVLAGVYRGFTAATPGGSGDVKPEESTNYEIGGRYSGMGQAEVIAFLNDYTQFSGTCSFSQGSCNNNNIGNQANAGNAQVYGVEASWSNELELASYMVPVSMTYTYSKGEFGEEFTDGTSAFGEANLKIEKGFEIGYLPEHRLNIQTGIQRGDWRVNLSALYQSEMRNVPGKGEIPEEDKIDAFTVFDLSANYQLTEALQVYSTVDNLLDEEYVVSAKPYGFRPGKPRSVNVGAKFKF